MEKRPAIAVGAEVLRTYDDLAVRVAHIASALRKHYKLKAGDRVALTLNNCPEYIELLYAIWHAGLVAVPVNRQTSQERIRIHSQR